MSNKTRNSVLLACLFLVIAGGDYYWLVQVKGKQLGALAATRMERQASLQAFQARAAQYPVFADSLQCLQDSLAHGEKIVLSREDSKTTYEYLNHLATLAGGLEFEFHYKEVKDLGEYQASDYLLEGTSYFGTLYKFLWKLDHFKRVYRINTLEVQEIKVTDETETPKSRVHFRMAMTGYSSGRRAAADSVSGDPEGPIPLQHNAFLPLVREHIPPNRENLLDVALAKLHGLTADRAFITDAAGNLLEMRVGDKVYLGFLTRIDQEGNRVEFALNKGGFLEKVTLHLETM